MELTASSPHPVNSPSIARRLAVVLLAALVSIAALLSAAPAALAEAPRSITVVDTTGDLNAAPLTERLQRTDFRRSVDVVALTVDVTAHGRSASDDRALNDTVLELARSEHPDWLSPGGAYWRDGLVIIAIDPAGRFIGAYAGEDVKLSEDDFVSIQEAMRPAAREGDWNGAVVAGAEQYASLLDRPIWLHPAAILAALAAVGVAGLSALAALWRGASVRAKARHAIERYDAVMLTFAETELAARTIPASSTYGEPVLRDYEEFSRRAAEATQLREQLPARLGLLWGMKPGRGDLTRRFAATTERIDALDDEIVATNDLLSRSNQWRSAWGREMQPIRDSLTQVDTAIRQAPQLADAPTAQALRTVAANVEAGLARTTASLENGSISPDDALGELDLMTSALGRAATAHRDAVIAATARDEGEAQVMRQSGAGYGGGYGSGYGTIRGRRWHYYPTMYDPLWNLSPILWLSTWQHSASSDLDAYRNPPAPSGSDSGGFTGYSGGGGGFSGAGSSGRF